jgi:uncharacterized MAPEG superfamily protein
VQVKTRQYGDKWNVGARDEELPPPKPLVGRLARAQANFLETFPIMIAAVLIVSAVRITDKWTGKGHAIQRMRQPGVANLTGRRKGPTKRADG